MPYIPRLTRSINHHLYAKAVRPILAELLDDGLVHIIDAHFCWPDGVAAAILASEFDLPYTITIRGLLNRYASQLTKRRAVISALKNATAIVAVSQSLRKQALHLGVKPSRIHVISNGVDTAIFKPANRHNARTRLNLSPDESVLITVGHLCRRKGVHRIIRMLPHLIRNHDNLRYVVLGDDAAEGRFRTKLKNLVGRLRLQDRVTFTGALPPDIVATWLQAADLFVLATSNEGCCNAICEAQATGLPVITTDVGGNRELVDPTRGRLVSGTNDNAFLDAILDFLDAPSSIAEPPKATPRSWDNVACETAEVLENAHRAHCAKHTAAHLINSPLPTT